MSHCAVCHIDSKKHSKTLWQLHKQIRKCTFCRKTSDAHSEELWQMHNSVVEKALRGTRHKKLWTMQIGSGRDCPAVLDTDYRQDGHHDPAEWLIPIYMSCTECSLYLGNIEEDYADILSGMCLKCFREMTRQKEVN